jgi:hypothetical protein
MAAVGIVLVTYLFYPEKLFETIVEKSRHSVKWYVFFHGPDESLKHRLDVFCRQSQSAYFPYGVNRGLPKSWNDGLIASCADENEVHILLNDDIVFYDGAFDEFIDFVVEQQNRAPNFGIISPFGKELAPAGQTGAVDLPEGQLGIPQHLACAAIGLNALRSIGYFDENFGPVYYGDIDYIRRLNLTHVPILDDKRILVEHDRSLSLRRSAELKQRHNGWWLASAAYYTRKWGGDMGQENFTHPFNDERLTSYIGIANIRAPYGPGRDRDDIGIPF